MVLRRIAQAVGIRKEQPSNRLTKYSQQLADWTQDRDSRSIRDYLKQNAKEIEKSLSQRQARNQFGQLFELLRTPLDGLSQGTLDNSTSQEVDLNRIDSCLRVGNDSYQDPTIFGLGRSWFDEKGLLSDQRPKDFLESTTEMIEAELRRTKKSWVFLEDLSLAGLAGLTAARTLAIPAVFDFAGESLRSLDGDDAWAVLTRKTLRIFLQECALVLTDSADITQAAINYGADTAKLRKADGSTIEGLKPLTFVPAAAEFIKTTSAFKVTPKDQQLADDYLEHGHVLVQPHKVVTLSTLPTFWEDPRKDSNWRFSYNTFRWADVLRRQYQRTGKEEYRTTHLLLLKRWARTCLDSENEQLISHVWSDMGAAIRSRSIALAVQAYGYDAELVALLKYHLTWLLDPAHWPARGNHLLHVYHGIFTLARVLQDGEAEQKSVTLIYEYLRDSISVDGEDYEGSFMYQRSNMRWAKQLIADLKACGQGIPQDIEKRICLMQNVIDYAMDYGGTYAQYGDSDKATGRAVKIGTKLSVPDGEHTAIRPVHTYPLAGIGVIRMEPEDGHGNVFVLVRAHPGETRQVHGHQDHGQVIYSIGKTQVLRDSGRYTYGANSKTRYLKSASAHTVAVPTDRGLRRPLVNGSFTYQLDRGDFRAIAVSSQYDEQTTWHRTVCVHANGELDVYDYWDSAEGNTFDTFWQFGDYEVEQTSSRSWIARQGGEAAIQMMVDVAPADASVARGQSGPLAGYRSDKYGQFLPATRLHLQGLPPRTLVRTSLRVLT